MKLHEALDTLKSLGTEQNRKIYRRHGAREDVYGVSFAHLKDLKKKVKVDHELAEGLWQSGNHDARIFATMIADPKRLDHEALDSWSKGLAGYPESDAFGDLAAKSPAGREAVERFMKSDEEWTAAAGWRGIAHLVMNGGLSDEECEQLLARIEREIHSERNRVRYEMNNVVIAIGARNPDLREKAIAAAVRIGKVEVDHGETGCKTPEAVSYIRKIADRKKK